MLEHLFVRTHVVTRLRGGPMGPYLDNLATRLHQQGYAPSSVQSYLRTSDTFGRWLHRQGYTVSELDEAVLQRYVAGLKRYRCGHLPKAAEGLNHLFTFLQQQGVISHQPAVVPTAPVDQWLAAYDAYLKQVVGLAVGTCQGYLPMVRRFMNACFGSQAPDWQSLTAPMITTFVRHEAARRQGASRKMPAVAVRSFLRFLVFRGELRPGLEAATPPPPQWTHASLPSRLSPLEVEQVLATYQDGTANSLRNRAMLLLLARLGLRAHEVVLLCLDDIDWVHGHLDIRPGKTRQARRLPLTQEVGQALVAYVQGSRPQRDHRQVFLQCRPPFHPLTRCAVWWVVRRAFQRVGLATRPRTGSHIFRHYFVYRVIPSGAVVGSR
jgi:integrase/recombinase XerD